MGRVQRDGQVVVVASTLILRDEWQEEGASAAQGPEGVEPGLINIRVDSCLEWLLLKQHPLLSDLLPIGAYFYLPRPLAEWLILSCPQAIKTYILEVVGNEALPLGLRPILEPVIVDDILVALLVDETAIHGFGVLRGLNEALAGAASVGRVGLSVLHRDCGIHVGHEFLFGGRERLLQCLYVSNLCSIQLEILLGVPRGGWQVHGI